MISKHLRNKGHCVVGKGLEKVGVCCEQRVDKNQSFQRQKLVVRLSARSHHLLLDAFRLVDVIQTIDQVEVGPVLKEIKNKFSLSFCGQNAFIS